MKFPRNLSIAFFLTLSINLLGQGWEMEFLPDSLFGLPSWSVGLEVQNAPDGGYVLAAEVDMPTGAIRHYLRLIRTNDSGMEQWSHTYHFGAVTARDIAFLDVLDHGEVIAVGNNLSDPYFFRINTDGEIIFEKIFYPDTSVHISTGLSIDDEHILMVGNQNNFHAIFIQKINTDGNIDWWVTHSFDYPFFASSVIKDEDLNYFISGRLGSNAALIKVDSSGNLIWTREYNFLNITSANVVKSTGDGGFIIGGKMNGIQNFLSLLIKTDSLGVIEWMKTYLEEDNSMITDLVVKGDSTILATGSILSFWDFIPSGFLTHVDQNGEVISHQSFTNELKRFSAIKAVSEDELILCGTSSDNILLKKIGGTNSISPILQNNSRVDVFPNPMQSTCVFKIAGEPNKTIQLQFFDFSGKIVFEDKFAGDQYIFSNSSLPPGVYFYKINSSARPLYSGRLVIHN